MEFQGRGTLHIHVVAWAIIQPGVQITGRVVDKTMVAVCATIAQDLFKSNVDVA